MSIEQVISSFSGVWHLQSKCGVCSLSPDLGFCCCCWLVGFLFVMQVHDLSFDCLGIHFKQESTSKMQDLKFTHCHIELDKEPSDSPPWGTYVLETLVDSITDQLGYLFAFSSLSINSCSYVLNSPIKSELKGCHSWSQWKQNPRPMSTFSLSPPTTALCGPQVRCVIIRY